MSELRWNALLGEWTVTATHRQDRTYLPPPEYCPLCPTRQDAAATEVPAADYEIVVFENRFPSFSYPPPAPALKTDRTFVVKEAAGRCEVVVYTSDHHSTLARASVERIARLIDVWADLLSEAVRVDGVLSRGDMLIAAEAGAYDASMSFAFAHAERRAAG